MPRAAREQGSCYALVSLLAVLTRRTLGQFLANREESVKHYLDRAYHVAFWLLQSWIEVEPAHTEL